MPDIALAVRADTGSSLGHLGVGSLAGQVADEAAQYPHSDSHAGATFDSNRVDVTDFLVRRVRLEDWPLVRAIRLAMLADDDTAFGSATDASLALNEERWHDQFHKQTAWVAFSDGEAVGSVAVSGDEDPSTESVHTILWIAPEHRLSGVFRRRVEPEVSGLRLDRR